jgi:hypothetical protein
LDRRLLHPEVLSDIAYVQQMVPPGKPLVHPLHFHAAARVRHLCQMVPDFRAVCFIVSYFEYLYSVIVEYNIVSWG